MKTQHAQHPRQNKQYPIGSPSLSQQCRMSCINVSMARLALAALALSVCTQPSLAFFGWGDDPSPEELANRPLTAYSAYALRSSGFKLPSAGGFPPAGCRLASGLCCGPLPSFTLCLLSCMLPADTATVRTAHAMQFLQNASALADIGVRVEEVPVGESSQVLILLQPASELNCGPGQLEPVAAAKHPCVLSGRAGGMPPAARGSVPSAAGLPLRLLVPAGDTVPGAAWRGGVGL